MPSSSGVVDLVFPVRDFRNSYSQQGNVAIEHEVMRNLGVTVSYLWSRGLHLTTSQDINVGPTGAPVTYRINDLSGQQVGTYQTPTYLRANRVNPRWNRVNVVDSGWKQLLQRAGRCRSASGCPQASKARLLTPGRTRSITIRDPAATTSSSTADRRQSSTATIAARKESSAFDQRHRLTLSSIWAPTVTSRNRIASYVLNNWQLSQIWTVASTPFATGTVTVSGTPFTGAAFNGSLNGLGGSTRVPFWPVNNTGIDSIAKVDARLTRVISISERLKLHLNMEAFNAFNHTYFTLIQTQAFTAVNGVLTPQPRFGQGSATGGFPDGTNARRLQASIRVLW